MGWSPHSRDQVATYTRGAKIELAGDTPMPLMSKKWRSPDAPSRYGTPARMSPLPVPRPRGQGIPSAAPAAPVVAGRGLAHSVLAQIQSDPELRRELIAALLDGEC